MKINLRRLEWGLFANELSLISSYVMIGGGILGIVEGFPRWQLAVYSIIAGVIVFILEYPRSYSSDIKFVERRFQKYIEPCIILLGFYGRSYFVRFVFYLCLSVPCFFLLPTFVGGACIGIASVIYLTAAAFGIEWQPVYRMPMHSISFVAGETKTYNSLDFMRETIC